MHVNHLKLFKSSKGEHIKHKLSGGRRRWGFTQMTVYKVWTLESCCFSPTGPWADYAVLASLIYKLAFLNAIATLSLSLHLPLRASIVDVTKKMSFWHIKNLLYYFTTLFYNISTGSQFLDWAQKANEIWAQRTRYNEFVESGSKN